MLTIDSLSKTYSNGVQALSDVSLDIPKGMFGLLGPNGAGKSTLMRTLSTLQAADQGTIRFDGVEVSENVDGLRARLGYLPQEFGVYPRTSPLRFLDHVAVLKGVVDKKARQDQIERLLKRTNLWEVRKKSMTTFSGGMKQRIGIAQALIGSPDLIIVDEPTAGLDPVERRRFHNLLAEIGEDVVVILSTHIVEDVADLCSNMAVMAQGRILARGEPRTLIEDLEGRLWQRIVDRTELDPIRAQLELLSVQRSAGRMKLKVVGDSPPDGFESAQPDLEDVYFATLAAAGVDVDVE